jgi:hypothetical protein
MDWHYITSSSQIEGGGGGYCLTLTGPDLDGGLVTISPCDRSDVSQRWSIQGQTIHNAEWGCLDLDSKGDNTPTKVQIWDCENNGDPDQLWRFSSD